MTINGKTRVCGVIADPVEHSLSPVMHNFYAEQTGINLAYVPFRVPEEQVGEAVLGAFALNLLGLNVTVPHKQQVMKYVTELDPGAEAIGAVNTLVRTAGGYKGYNTDADGLFRALQGQGISLKGESCILLGAGGAARAVAYLLAREGAREVYILNRSGDKAELLAEEMNRRSGREVMRGMAVADWKQLPGQSYLAIQTTSVGMHPDTGSALIEAEAFYKMLHTAVDIVYVPARTRFMELAGAQGAKTMNGLDMLLYQGIIAYELWNPGVRIGASAAAEARTLMQRHLGGTR